MIKQLSNLLILSAELYSGAQENKQKVKQSV